MTDSESILGRFRNGETLDERRARGRALRKQIPRSSFQGWTPVPDRVDVVTQLAEQEVTRVPELVPVRHERMAESPFTFFRGAAKVFAADLAPFPRTGLTVQLCGDAHLANFGGFASPERNLVFDINDFDETLPGPFEWDLLRLAASFEIAARSNGFESGDREKIQLELVTGYAKALRNFSAMTNLDVWYSSVNFDDLDGRWADELSRSMRRRVEDSAQKAQSKDRLKAMKKLTTTIDGQPRFLSDPPLLQPASDLLPASEHHRLVATIDQAISGYRLSLAADRRFLLDRYELVDLAHKVVGVGSVGTRFTDTDDAVRSSGTYPRRM